MQTKKDNAGKINEYVLRCDWLILWRRWDCLAHSKCTQCPARKVVIYIDRFEGYFTDCDR